MINTYNETSLHNELKNRYAQRTNGKTEQKIGKYICDIETEKGDIIEIQTKNLAKLTGKIANLLQEKRKLCLVYPLVCINYIERYDEKGSLLTRRKSPKKNTIYQLFDELMGIYPILLYKNFILEVLLIEQTEIRTVTPEPVQLENKSRRRLKPWIKSNKKLGLIIGKKQFSSKKQYLDLFPKNTPNIFCAKDLSKTEVGKQAHKMLWVLNKMGLIKRVENDSRTFYYQIIK